MKIYTKTGDNGQTGLVGNARIRKDSARISAIGDVDELNACVGLARTHSDRATDDDLAKIQNWLFDFGAELATLEGSKFVNDNITEDHVGWLERSIDEQTEKLSPLRNFVLPGGTPLAAALHHARCVCRRAERSVLALHRQEPVREVTRKFLNRLSDWLFVKARTSNAEAGVEDIEWTKS